MTTIYLIRHGEIPRHSPRRFIGRSDFALTDHGRQQIRDLPEKLLTEKIEKIYCSPLLRCRESAEILGSYSGGVIEIIKDLAEIDLGAWEGLTVAEVQQRYPGSYQARGLNLSTFRPPGGESFSDLLERTRIVFKKIAETNTASVAVVAHAGVNRVLLCDILGMPLENMFRLEQNFACINTIHFEKGAFCLARMNG
jgi:probable phosphoglycerate mutase